MNKERLKYLIYEMYYNNLNEYEAQELIDYIKNLEDKINKSIHLIYHNDILDYRIFEEKLLEILEYEKNDTANK